MNARSAIQLIPLDLVESSAQLKDIAGRVAVHKLTQALAAGAKMPAIEVKFENNRYQVTENHALFHAYRKLEKQTIPARIINEVKIDNREGAGATPDNANVDYKGLRVQMRPSVFLKLAAPLGREHDSDLEKYIADGGAIGAPLLDLRIPDAWDDGDYITPAKIRSHEGRNRMSAILKAEGDEPVEVHLFSYYHRNRDFTPDFIKHLNRGMIAEKSDNLVRGPLFSEAAVTEVRLPEFTQKKLVIFDIDDTLVHTETKVHVVKDGKTIHELNSHEFTHYKLKPGEEFDFGRFRDAQEFFEKARPNLPMINQLKHDIETGNKVVMVTARADFNDRETFLNTFRRFGIDMSRVHVYRAGNIKSRIPTEEKKKIIVKSLLERGNFTKAIMYDDAVPNLKTFVELKVEFPKTKFYAWHVSLAGEAHEYERTNESKHTYIDESKVETVDIDAIHAEGLREHLLSNPALYENQEDYKKLREFLDTHSTHSPKENNHYLYASVQVTPISKYIHTTHFNNDHELVKLDNRWTYFNINGDVKRFPESKDLTGDALSQIYFFDSKKEFEHFTTLLQLTFSDYKQSSKILDKSAIGNALQEAATAVLYHYTGANGALQILRDREFKLSSSTGTQAEIVYAPKGYPYFLSTTRSKVGDYHRYTPYSAAMFVLDGAWLNAHGYKTKPIDYWDRMWLSSGRSSESEDRIFSKTNTMPMTMVRELHLFINPESDEPHRVRIRQCLILAKQEDIPVFLYTTRESWVLQDKRRAVKPSEIKSVLKGSLPSRITRPKASYLHLGEWLELIFKDQRSQLSAAADKLRYSLIYYSYNDSAYQGLENDMHNSRKPGSDEYDEVVKINAFMAKNKLNTIKELYSYLLDKWKTLNDAEMARRDAEKNISEATQSDNIKAFMADYYDQTTDNPMSFRERIYNNQVTIELSPFHGRIHLSDIRSLSPGSGAGTAGLKFLIGLAKKHGVAIEAIAKAYHKDKKYIRGSDRLKDWYLKHGFRLVPDTFGDDSEGYDIEYIPEGWREKALGLAGAAAMYTGLNAMPAPDIQKAKEPAAQIQQVAQPAKPAPTASVAQPVKTQPKVALQTDSPTERALYEIATREGIKGNELAQFMAQCKHESWDFEKMHEIGSLKKLAKRYAAKPSLGNRGYKEAARFIGRGPMQITGRENYERASKYLYNKFNSSDSEFLMQYGVYDDPMFLVNRPELMADPTIGAYAAVWYWKSRVRPNVDSFDDTKSVTRQINPALRGLDRRQANYLAYRGEDQG